MIAAQTTLRLSGQFGDRARATGHCAAAAAIAAAVASPMSSQHFQRLAQLRERSLALGLRRKRSRMRKRIVAPRAATTFSLSLTQTTNNKFQKRAVQC